METSLLNKGIEEYYQRNRQNKYGNSYYLMTKDDISLEVLNDHNRFIIIAFDQADRYIVVNNQRYYLTKENSIKCTQHQKIRIAIVDLTVLAKAKSYPFDNKFHHKYTAIFKDFDELRSLAQEQWQAGGSPWVHQQAVYNKETGKCKYLYELSCKQLRWIIE